MLIVWNDKKLWKVVGDMTEQEFKHNAITMPRKLFKIDNGGHVKEVNYFAVTFRREVK